MTWYHHGKRWKTKFKLVIGIIHTNYLEYVKREKNGAVQAFLLKYLNNWVVGIYCHKASYYILMENSTYAFNVYLNILAFTSSIIFVSIYINMKDFFYYLLFKNFSFIFFSFGLFTQNAMNGMVLLSCALLTIRLVDDAIK